PLLFGLIYVLAVFCHGFENALEEGESCCPTRMFALPVRTLALVGWPLACGAAALALLWLAVALLVLRPCGLQAPLLWPACLLVALLAWSQALLWLPFGLRWLRVIAGTAAPTRVVGAAPVGP